MEKSHKIYNLIFDFLLAAGVCFYNDLRFMRFWFLGGQLYHSVGFANYRFGLTGKEVCWDFSPLNILHCLQGYDPHAYLKFLCFFCIGILMFFRFVFRAPKLLPRLFARLFCFSAGYIAVVELYNLLFTAAGAVFLDISNWFLYLTGAWSADMPSADPAAGCHAETVPSSVPTTLLPAQATSLLLLNSRLKTIRSSDINVSSIASFEAYNVMTTLLLKALQLSLCQTRVPLMATLPLEKLTRCYLRCRSSRRLAES